MKNNQLIFVCISDTHGKHGQLPPLPKGDVLLFAGDCMTSGFSFPELTRFINWFSTQPHEVKIMIAGNHDRPFEENPDLTKKLLERYPNIIYLENSGVEVAGIKIWGTPDTKKFGRWAFNKSDKDLEEIYSRIPVDTNILLSHGPAKGIRDMLVTGQEVGEIPLLQRIGKLPLLKYHIFGHIHHAQGTSDMDRYYAINCSVVNEAYELHNNPIVFGYDLKS